MLRRPTHTYGKRSSRSKNGRSTSRAPTQAEDSSHGSSQDGHQVREAPIVNESPVKCIKQASSAISSNAGPFKKRSMLPTASTSRVPEVIIYSPSKRAKVDAEDQSKAIESSMSSLPPSSTNPPTNSTTTYQPLRDYKGKGTMQEIPVKAGQSSSESSSTESDCVTVTSKALSRTIPRTSLSSGEELPNSAVLSTPRRSTKRYPSSSPEMASEAFVSRNVSRHKIGLSSNCPKESLPGRSADHKASRHHSLKKPGLKSENSMDSLFDELLGDPKHYDGSPPYLSKAQDRELLLTHMASRPAASENTRATSSRSRICSVASLTLNIL